jgi:hypothetical protein
MFTPFDPEDSNLDAAIAAAFSDLSQLNASGDAYQTAVDNLSKLYALKNNTAQLTLQIEQASAAQQLANDQNTWQEEQESRPFYARVDPNTVLTVAGNILIGLAVIKYEQTGVISSKVMSFMRKI